MLDPMVTVKRSPGQLSRRRIFGSLMILYLIWGSSYVGFKVSFETLPPLLSTGLCFGAAGVGLLVWSYLRGARLSRDDLLTGTVLGVVMIGVATGGVVVGVSHLNSSTAALIQASIPMWVAVGDRLIFRNRLGVRTVAGLAIGFVGIFSLVGLGRGQGAPPLEWMILILVASMAWAGGILASRVLPRSPDWILSVGLQLSIGGALCVVAGAVHGDFAMRYVDHLRVSSVLAWFYLLGSNALIGYCLFMWLIPRAPASLLATANYVDPIVTLVLGWAILHESVGPRSIVATVIILTGVVLIVSSNPPVVAESPGNEPVPVPKHGSAWIDRGAPDRKRPEDR